MLPVALKLPAITSPVALINPVVNTLPLATLPVALINPVVRMLPLVMLPVVDTGLVPNAAKLATTLAFPYPPTMLLALMLVSPAPLPINNVPVMLPPALINPPVVIFPALMSPALTEVNVLLPVTLNTPLMYAPAGENTATFATPPTPMVTLAPALAIETLELPELMLATDVTTPVNKAPLPSM